MPLQILFLEANILQLGACPLIAFASLMPQFRTPNISASTYRFIPGNTKDHTPASTSTWPYSFHLNVLFANPITDPISQQNITAS
jgi:hypothetical protein